MLLVWVVLTMTLCAEKCAAGLLLDRLAILEKHPHGAMLGAKFSTFLHSCRCRFQQCPDILPFRATRKGATAASGFVVPSHFLRATLFANIIEIHIHAPTVADQHDPRNPPPGSAIPEPGRQHDGDSPLLFSTTEGIL